MVGYWPFNAHACGFWFLPMAWQFSCDKCMGLSGNTNSSFGGMLCANHSSLEHFLTRNAYSSRPIFVGLSSIGRCVSHPILLILVFLLFVSLCLCIAMDLQQILKLCRLMELFIVHKYYFLTLKLHIDFLTYH
jgi:hypothetical protein